MLGSVAELKWNRKDLESYQKVLPYVRNRQAVVQAGGCLGVFAQAMARDFQAVYTFEPDPENFAKLVYNVPAVNVVKFQAALGCEPRMLQTVCELRPNDGKSVLHEGMTRTEPGGIVPTLRIDDLGLTACGLFYLDVEGDELFALRGADQTIRQCRPVIACEINRGLTYRGLSEQDVLAYLLQYGYYEFARHRSDVVFLPEEWQR